MRLLSFHRITWQSAASAARLWSTCTVDCVCCHKLRDVFQSSLTLMAMLTVNRNYLFVNGYFRFCRHSVSVRPSVRPSVCPSVSLYVTFVRSVETNKNIFEMFSPAGSHTILVFPYETGWRYSDGNPSPLMGASNARGYEK